MDILREYQRVIEYEYELQGRNDLGVSMFVREARGVEKLCRRLIEIAKSSLVPRSYLKKYHLTDEKIVFESVAAHTNLVAALVDNALMYEYGPDFGEVGSEFPETTDGYSPRVIAEVVRLHDLPENEIGDIPDDGARDEAEKEARERDYFSRYLKDYPSWATPFREKVRKLLLEMEEKVLPTGRLLYAADKLAAMIITLTCDSLGCMPMLHREAPSVSGRDVAEMDTCDPHGDFGDWHKASEMWTIDFLSIRKLCQYDDTGFFTAVLIMTTLIVNGRWYDWREKEYLS